MMDEAQLNRQMEETLWRSMFNALAQYWDSAGMKPDSSDEGVKQDFLLVANVMTEQAMRNCETFRERVESVKGQV